MDKHQFVETMQKPGEVHPCVKLGGEITLWPKDHLNVSNLVPFCQYQVGLDAKFPQGPESLVTLQRITIEKELKVTKEKKATVEREHRETRQKIKLSKEELEKAKKREALQKEIDLLEAKAEKLYEKKDQLDEEEEKLSAKELKQIEEREEIRERETKIQQDKVEAERRMELGRKVHEQLERIEIARAKDLYFPSIEEALEVGFNTSNPQPVSITDQHGFRIGFIFQGLKTTGRPDKWVLFGGKLDYIEEWKTSGNPQIKNGHIEQVNLYSYGITRCLEPTKNFTRVIKVWDSTKIPSNLLNDGWKEYVKEKNIEPTVIGNYPTSFVHPNLGEVILQRVFPFWTGQEECEPICSPCTWKCSWREAKKCPHAYKESQGYFLTMDWKTMTATYEKVKKVKV